MRNIYRIFVLLILSICFSQDTDKSQKKDKTKIQFIELNRRIEELSIEMRILRDSLLSNPTTILRIKQQNSFNDAFLMARLNLGPKQKFEWNGKVYKTDYDNELKAPPLVIAIDSLKYNFDKKSSELDAAIKKANKLIAKVNEERKNEIISLDKSINEKNSVRNLYIIIAILTVLLIVIFFFFVLRSKVSQQQDSILNVKETQDKLENEAISLDTKLIQILEQKLEISQQVPFVTEAVDHSLPLKLAEEIHRMRKRLNTMEESHGTKVLNKRIDSLTDKINDLGYEIIKLEGEDFNEGMTVDANFIPDENLDEGKEIISRVIKPQINYKGKLIQPAKVEVAQGIN